MNQQFGPLAFGHAEQFLKDAHLPENVQALAQQSVAKTQEFYTKGAAAAQESAKVLTEVIETAWGSTKMLNEKLVQNLSANIDASFAAAHAIAKAQSLPDAFKLQAEFFQKLTAQTTEQTKEYFDLSTRATQHVLEQVQAATTRAMKSVA